MVNPKCLISHCGLNLPFSDDGGIKNNSVFSPSLEKRVVFLILSWGLGVLFSCRKSLGIVNINQ